jgi:hypothetical protein
MRVTFFDKTRNRPKVQPNRGKRGKIGFTVIDGVWGYGLGAPVNRLAISRVAG